MTTGIASVNKNRPSDTGVTLRVGGFTSQFFCQSVGSLLSPSQKKTKKQFCSFQHITHSILIQFYTFVLSNMNLALQCPLSTSFTSLANSSVSCVKGA